MLNRVLAGNVDERGSWSTSTGTWPSRNARGNTSKA